MAVVATGEPSLENVAARLARDQGRLDAMPGEEAAEALPDSIHPRLVAAAAVDVHDFGEHGDHRIPLVSEPIAQALLERA